MNHNKRVSIKDISRPLRSLLSLDPEDLKPLPKPLDRPGNYPKWPDLTPEQKEKYECSLDGFCALSLPKPKSREEENELVRQFLAGLEKCFQKEENWTFLQPFILSMEYCAKCQTCNDACHIYEASNKADIYRPTYRSEVLRRIYNKYLKPGGRLFGRWSHGDIKLNWATVSRLAELAYRCNLCRRCAQTCPIGVDNALITREIRKIFSQEMGIAPKEIHKDGSILQLKVGSSTGMNPTVVKDNVEFIDEDTSEQTGIDVKTPWDVEGADILLIHNAGEIMAWPENPGAFAVILNAAGLSWTLSSETCAYDAVNYGVWYDDVMFARVALEHARIAKKLGVKKIVIGECGHAHKALTVIADRVLPPELDIPRESSMTLLRDIVMNDRIKLDPSRNSFPVTLHDPCNMVRLMGIVEPQREILRKICPQFREMTPHGVDNYCCGGGSGFAIMRPNNFEHWRYHVSGRKKMEQVLNAFSDCIGPETPKYLCAPCSNCKGQLRDIMDHFGVFEKSNIIYGGLVELIVNAMMDVKPGFIKWEKH